MMSISGKVFHWVTATTRTTRKLAQLTKWIDGIEEGLRDHGLRPDRDNIKIDYASQMIDDDDGVFATWWCGF